MSPAAIVLAAVTLVVAATLAIGAIGLRVSRTTRDFYVASRVVSPRANASAVSGEYLSAASFLGVAGLVLVGGVQMLWFPIGYTAGYLALLCLVAAPLRRSGAYTLPDFAQWRLGKPRVRRVSALLVVGVGWLYLLPQLQGAGLALRSVVGTPRIVGSVLVAGVVLLNVLAGGMRSVTLVQVFQYWLKVVAISIPLLLLAGHWATDQYDNLGGPPIATETVTVTTTESLRLRAGEPTTITVDGVVDGHPMSGPLTMAAGERVLVGKGATITLTPGQSVPAAVTAGAAPELDPTQSRPSEALYRTYSLLLALTLGTMGLPHVLVRFYTNPDGRDARRTAATVVGLLGLFYAFPPLYGVMGRRFAPDLLITGRADAVVLDLPRRLIGEPWASVLVALLVGGAVAAFLATSSGIVVAVSGVRGYNLSGVAMFRLSALVAVLVPLALSMLTPRASLAGTVSLVFAVAASTFGPLLLLGVWWRGLTADGAVAGLLVGGTASIGAVVVSLLPLEPPSLVAALLAQPAAWSIPLTFATMIVGSRMTGKTVPAHVNAVMARLHSPERAPHTSTVTGR
jgi:Na+(H+)/acetate symporter ActP